MFCDRSHLRIAAALGGLLCCCTLAFGATSDASAAHKTAASASRYPAAATRTRLYPRRSQYARAQLSATKKRKKKSRKPALRGNPLRALLAFQTMQKIYYIQGSGLYDGEPFSYLWPFS